MGQDASTSVIPHAIRNEMFRTNTLDWESLNLPREKYNINWRFGSVDVLRPGL